MCGSESPSCTVFGMKPDKLPSWDDLTPALGVISDSTIPIELHVLRCHLVTEVELYRLLSARLGIHERHLPNLQFYPLAALALGGDELIEVRTAVLALNDLRNEFSHELDPSRLNPAFARFVPKAGMYWPERDIFNKPQEFEALRDSAVRLAASWCVCETFCAFLAAATQRSDFPHDRLDRARETLAAVRQMQKDVRDKQRDVRKVFEK